MVVWDAGPTLADRFRAHAGSSQHLYGYAMRGMAEDWEADGPVREICAGYEDAPNGAVIQLRLLAGLFRLVLAGHAPELQPYYACLGGDRPPSQGWPVMLEVMAAHVPELHEALSTAPQTNEVGRSAALLAGLFDLVAETGLHQVRLLELGASAGLNLLIDSIGYSGTAWRWGPMSSPLQLRGAIEGPVRPQPFAVVDRAGCDLLPVDANSLEGRQLLTSFVWPFDLHRHARLAAAFRLAAAHPLRVDGAAASRWLPERLAAAPEGPDVLNVVWQSITQLYWSPEEIATVDEVVLEHGREHTVARVVMEYDPDPALADGLPPAGHTSKPSVRTLLLRPGAEPRRQRLGTAHDHGIPVRLSPERVSPQLVP
ncbi:DUF2332 domain-containing protein [uncultured Friedmanniella sp.]|uniref:DUF2332 domain-containing protein n=1 Tax=uncultured Friedmanniella sp. TaxID=335381 RepID=UPI0035C99A73